MAVSATVIGALLGLGTQMYSNALRKLPYMRHPWEHVLGMGLGAVFVNQLVKWDAQLQQDLDKMLEKAKQANERRYFASFWTSSLLRAWEQQVPLTSLSLCFKKIATISFSSAIAAKDEIADITTQLFHLGLIADMQGCCNYQEGFDKDF
ncbi:hypothetical protein PTKIN_Ptkin10aG0202600 [Pterospermum kingtungense]